MDQHACRISLRPSEEAMFGRSGGRGGVTVLTGHLGTVQTYHYVVHQPRQMPGALLVGKTKVVKLRRALGSCQPICDQRGLTACKDCSHALTARRLWFIVRRAGRVCDWNCEWSSHIKHSCLIETDTTIAPEAPLNWSIVHTFANWQATRLSLMRVIGYFSKATQGRARQFSMSSIKRDVKKKVLPRPEVRRFWS